MKKKVFIVFMLIVNLGYTQETIPDIRHAKPDYEDIKKQTLDSNSSFYYAKLFKKFSNGQQMTSDEKRYLYFGTIFQEGYDKEYTSDLLNEIAVITNKANPSDEDFDNLLDYSEKILEENPFNLEALNYATYVYRKKGMELQNQLAMIKFNIIVDAIFSAGDGITEKNAFHVIHNRDKIFLPKIIGYAAENGSDSESNYIKLKANKKGIEGFWYYIYN